MVNTCPTSSTAGSLYDNYHHLSSQILSATAYPPVHATIKDVKIVWTYIRRFDQETGCRSGNFARSIQKQGLSPVNPTSQGQCRLLVIHLGVPDGRSTAQDPYLFFTFSIVSLFCLFFFFSSHKTLALFLFPRYLSPLLHLFLPAVLPFPLHHVTTTHYIVASPPPMGLFLPPRPSSSPLPPLPPAFPLVCADQYSGVYVLVCWYIREHTSLIRVGMSLKSKIETLPTTGSIWH